MSGRQPICPCCDPTIGCLAPEPDGPIEPGGCTATVRIGAMFIDCRCLATWPDGRCDDCEDHPDVG